MPLQPRSKIARLNHENIALVLQGGGALGAYQAGVFEELATIPREPTWVAGVSIGAINAALIAGNERHLRVKRLRDFWEQVSTGVGTLAPLFDSGRRHFHQLSAAVAAVFGVPEFYRPQMPPFFLQPDGSPGALSIYDTAPLKTTLERLIDFDLINAKRTRLSIGAVNVRTGNSVYFDNTEREIRAEHIMASGALPPAFAPVIIDGDAYWDGGIVSNTPLQYVLDHCGAHKTMVVQVDLFSARGEMPVNLAEVSARQKDIVFSSRTRFNTDKAAELRAQKRAICNLVAKLPPRMKNDPDVKRLLAASQIPHIDIVHLIYRQSRHELDSKDYEFSRHSVNAHWQAGNLDMAQTLDDPHLLTSSSPDEGITVYDLAVSSSQTQAQSPAVRVKPARKAIARVTA